jgi:Spy/CpxP family protein refolding chaperone
MLFSLVSAAMLVGCSSGVSAANKTKFCQDNATMHKVAGDGTQSTPDAAGRSAHLLKVYRDNQATINDLGKTAPAEVQVDAQLIMNTLNDAIKANSLDGVSAKASSVSPAFDRVDVYCRQSSSGTPIGSTPSAASPAPATAPTAVAAGNGASGPEPGCPLTTAQVSAAVGQDMTEQAHSDQGLCGFQSNTPATAANPIGAPLVAVYQGPTDLGEVRGLLTAGGATLLPQPQWGSGAFQRPPKSPPGTGNVWAVEGYVPNFHFLLWTTQADHSSSDTSQLLDKIVQAAAR